MGLNVKDIRVRLFKVVHVSYDSSYKFLQRHPKLSCVLLICTILYIFLSYIYNFLAYLSPFLICAAIFLRVFWSSEKTELRYVKKKEEKVVVEEKENQEIKKVEKVETEPNQLPNILPNIPKPVRRDLLYKYPSQNATSRRRNFRERKWDVYGGLEDKAKDLSAVFQNEFIKRNIESFEKGESSLYYGLATPGRKLQVPKKQTLRSEPSMVDLVEFIDTGMETEKLEDVEDEEDEDTQEDRNKAIEWTENDQKNLQDLGLSEMERNKRLENLMARRSQRKLLKVQLEKPSLMAPLRVNGGFDSSKDIDEIEMPGSAPTVMPRSPYDIPYEPSEEKPNLSGDRTFFQEYNHQKDMPSFSSEQKQEPFSFQGRKQSDKHTYSRFRNIPDKGNHDQWLIDQLIYNEGGENRRQESNPNSKEEETTHGRDENYKTDMNVEKVETSQETQSLSDETSTEPGLIPDITNDETVSKNSVPEPLPVFSKPHERFLNNTPTNINESSMYDSIPSPVDKRQETMFLADRRLCHTPTYSIASDLQVEVSEMGSPTSTVDENDDTNSSTDRDSVVYDGDIDRDVSSGSEDLWGASFHGPSTVRNEEEIVEDGNNNSKVSLRQIDEENAADVSSYSSRYDMPPDYTPTCSMIADQNIFGHTPTCCARISDKNIFGHMKYSAEQTEAPQSSNSSFVDQFPNQTHSENQQDGGNMSENLTNESEIINDVNNSATIEQDNTETSTSNEEPGPNTSLVSLESIDETSINSISSSPRSVLPDQTTTDDVSPSAFNQQMYIDSQQSNMEDMAQETLNGEPNTMAQNIHPLLDDVTRESIMEHMTQETSNGDNMPQNIEPLMDDVTDESHSVFNHSQQSNIEAMTQETLNGEHSSDTMPQNIHPLMDDITSESHSVDFNPSQEHTNSTTEKSIEESNNFGNMSDGETFRKEQQDKPNKEENGEENSTHQISQEDTSESTSQINEMTSMKDVDENSRDLVDDKVPLVKEESNKIPESGNNNIHEDLPQPMVPRKEENESHAEDS